MDSSGQRFSTHDNFLTIFGVSTKFDNLKEVNGLFRNVLLLLICLFGVAVVILAWLSYFLQDLKTQWNLGSNGQGIFKYVTVKISLMHLKKKGF